MAHPINDWIAALPEEEQEKLWIELSKKFPRVPREQKVPILASLNSMKLASFNGMNLVEMKTILTVTLAILETAMAQWKNPGPEKKRGCTDVKLNS